ncbi:hypothetical protein [Pseudomonas veronii]|uniref:hypothetical protein n=1 Tax=Pseudomonas TaxID=286 RepID=UPI0012327855|nr:hypothetical protein [Pseudomonas veronii]
MRIERSRCVVLTPAPPAAVPHRQADGLGWWTIVPFSLGAVLPFQRTHAANGGGVGADCADRG